MVSEVAVTVEEEFEYSRQYKLYDPDTHRSKLGTIALVGAGAIGSAAALCFAKMGITGLTVFDPDKVEVHNTPNQILYALDDKDKLKVDALRESIELLTSDEYNKSLFTSANFFRIKDAGDYSTLVLAVDSLEARRTIWQRVQGQYEVQRFLDLRMGGTVACAYAMQRDDEGSFDEEMMEKYSKLLVASDADECGAKSFAPTSMMCGALAGYTLAAWARGEKPGFETYLSFECTGAPFAIFQ